MKSTLKAVSVVFSSLLFLSCVAILIGRAQREQALLPGLNVCDGIPCYRNIIPLKTTYEEARSIIEQIPGITWNSLTSYRADFSDEFIRWVVIFQSGRGDVREIALKPHDNEVRLGSIIARFGKPCAVNPYKPNAFYQFLITIEYPTMVVWVQTIDWKLHPSSSVGEIEFIPPKLKSVITSQGLISPCEKVDGIVKYDWNGFARYEYK